MNEQLRLYLPGSSRLEDNETENLVILRSRELIPVSTASPHEGLSLSDPTNPEEDDSEIPPLEDIYQNSTDVPLFPPSRIHSSHPTALILGDPTSAVQTRSKLHLKFLSAFGERKKAIEDIGKEEGIDYDEVFAPVARLEAIRIFLAFASYMGFIVYQMDVKSAFLYGKIDEEGTYCVSPTDSDYAWSKTDRKSHNGGWFNFLAGGLISWQYKKQTIVATSTYRSQNMLLHASVVGSVFHSKTKHIAIRHHFIRDAYEKKLIQVLKIHTDDNVADLLTKAFDVSSTPDTYIVHSLVGQS
ncbi:putative ribonuclease H-like domain-containing protein [Tanacetum coccineum]